MADLTFFAHPAISPHAVLLDVIVHPSQQRKGIGQLLVTSTTEYAAFYKSCGFQIGLGGIYEI